MNIKSIISEQLNQLINECPDNIKLPSGEYLHCSHADAYPFLCDAEDLSYVYLGNAGRYHHEMTLQLFNLDPDIKTTYHGRIWLNRKIITFWEYPSVSNLHKIIKGLELAFQVEHKINIDILNDREFLIEVYTEDGFSLPIPIREYNGRTFKEPERIIHTLSTTEKQRLKELGLWKAYNTLYHNKRMEAGTKSRSAAEYRFAKERGIAENK